MLVLPDNIRILQKGDVKSDVGLRWQGLAGRGKRTLPNRDGGYVTPSPNPSSRQASPVLLTCPHESRQFLS
jgi:hypothetical protein